MDYIDLKYKPRNDLVCEFRIEPATRAAIEAVAGESSIGTWTGVKTMCPRIWKMRARVFEINGNCIRVAYPAELFEPGNIPQILSSVAGNIFGMKAVRNLRLEDVQFPASILKTFKGPKYGIAGVRKIMRIKKRPLIGTIIKPKLGLDVKGHAKVAYDAWVGGCDIAKDDENLSDQKFNRFENRVIETLKMKNKAERETGERKAYMPNVTAETNEMLRRAKFVEGAGGTHVMVDFVTVGFAGVQSLREADFDLILHGHRAMHAAMTHYKKHGISMLALADFGRLAGLDQIHIGTIVGKMEGKKSEVVNLRNEMEKKIIKPHGHVMAENWGNIKPVFAVCSGGLNPGHVPKLVEYLGKDIIIQMGGGVHGHPDGTTAGAKAARQAADATMQKIELREYSKTHTELAAALRKWCT